MTILTFKKHYNEKQSCEEKIRNYLLKHQNIKFIRKNDSNSEYYQCFESMIRLSDHIPYRINLPYVLNIIINNDTFAIIYGGRLINLNDYEDFKKFIKYFILIQDVTTSAIKVHSDKIESSENLIPKEDNIVNYIKFDGHLYNVSILTCKQINMINDLIKTKKICSKEELLFQINKFETQLINSL